MRESELQARCMRLARSMGLLPVNVHGSGWSNKGFPDLLVFGRGRVVAVELKSPTSGYRPQPDQLVWERRLRGQGIAHHFVSGEDEFGQVMREEFS